MAKFGFSLQEHYSAPISEVLDLLAETGFCAVSPGWRRDDDQAETVRLARSRGLTVQSLHGPLRGMRSIWTPEPGEVLQEMLDSATACAKMEIPILVVHPWNSVDYDFQKDALYFENFDRFMTHAEDLGIQVAFENLEGPEYLLALMERYEKAVYCWDSGHERCYAPGWDFLSLFGDRLVMTHLNDNMGVTDPNGQLNGTDDLHLLPGDGVLDWAEVLGKLKAAKHQEILNFELKIRPKGDRCILDLYSKLPLREYFREAYRRACQVTKDYF